MKSKKIQLYPYWMVVPAALFILVFYILPIGMGFVLSFTNWNIKYPTVEFVGLGNYINIWKDPEFQKALLNTLYFAGIILVARNVFALLLATVYKGNIIKNLIMDCQSYTKYRPNETTGGIFVSWRRKEELPTGA